MFSRPKYLKSFTKNVIKSLFQQKPHTNWSFSLHTHYLTNKEISTKIFLNKNNNSEAKSNIESKKNIFMFNSRGKTKWLKIEPEQKSQTCSFFYIPWDVYNYDASLIDHLAFCTKVSKDLKCSILMPDFAPLKDKSLDDIVDDIYNSYKAFSEIESYKGNKVYLVGSNLALYMASKIARADITQPKGLVLTAPSLNKITIEEHESKLEIVSDWLPVGYFESWNTKTKHIDFKIEIESVFFKDTYPLPEIFIASGTEETTFEYTNNFAEQLITRNKKVIYEVAENMPSYWFMLDPKHRESKRVYKSLIEFITNKN